MTQTGDTATIPAQAVGPAASGDGPDDDQLAELATHTWSKHLDDLAKTSFWAIARRLPAIVREAIEIGVQASKRDTITAIGLNLAAGVMTTLGLLATSGVLRQLFAAGPTPDRVKAALPALVVAAVAVMVRGAMMIAAGWAQARLIPRINFQAELRMFAAVTKVRQEAFDSHGFAQDMDRARDRGTQEAASIVDGTVNLTTGIVGVIATAVAVGVIEPMLLPCLLLVALPSAVTAIRMARRDYLAMLARITRRRRMWMLAVVMANRYTAAEIRHFEMRGFLLAEYERIMARETTSQMRLVAAQTKTRLAGVTLGGIALFGLYGLLGMFLLDGVIPLAAAGMALLAVQMARTSLNTAIHATNSMYEDALYYADYADLITRCQELAIPDGGKPVTGFDEITVKDVSLQYTDTDSLAVDTVSFTIRRGEVIALVGENGSGKSTLAKLLSGLYQPTAGTICWDGIPAAELDQAARTSLISVVSQDWWRFPFTAGRNITLGRNQADHNDDEVADAAMRTSADEVIAGLPKGLDTLLSKEYKDGADLSSGEWQRLVAARGFYRDAPLLICDEPSAALDARAEHKMFAQMRRHPGRAIVLITHRLANVRHADRIIVMDHGRIIETGTHDQLMTASGSRYCELWTMQAAGYLSPSYEES